MLKNPKTRLGMIVLAILVILAGILATYMIPTIQEVRREMSLTPTPLPPVPDSVMAVTPDPSAPTQAPVLRNGSKGQEVKDVQSRLAALGYYDRNQIDGEYGSGTREAVRAFQKANGLEADGIVGTETREVLFSADVKPFTDN